MNIYQCYYNRLLPITVIAETTYEAQKLAASLFGAKKTWKVDVYLLKLGDKDYEFSTAAL